ncbi:hypothetical protein ES705_45260 [subsurface metagenome]
MGEEGKHQGDEDITRRPEDEAIEAVMESGGGAIWVREDGALCIGDECMVIKPREGSRDLDIEISPSRCGQAVADIFADTIYKTIGRGGATHFKVQSELEGKKD